MVSGTYVQNYAESSHESPPLENWQQILAEASPLDPVWDIVSGRMTPDTVTHTSEEGNICLVRHFLPFAKKNSRQRGRVATPGLTSPVPQPRRECWNPRNLARSAAASRDRRQRLPRPSFVSSAYFSGAPTNQSPEVLAIASGGALGRALSEHGPCLVGVL